MADDTTYRKHNSFVGVRQKQTAADLTARIRSCRDSLETVSLDANMAAVVRRACDDLLGETDRPVHFELQATVAEEIRRLDDAELPRYLFYRYRYEIYPATKTLDAFPPCIQVEPTSVCNYRCVFCYQTDTVFTRKSEGHMGMMAPELFREIVDQAQGHVEAMTLASRGEPLAHSRFEEMIAYTAGKFLALKVNTNASYLDERLAHAMLSAGVGTVVFSADAAAEPAYSQLRVGGRLEPVLDNVRRFREIRERDYPGSRTITRVSGVKVPGTPDLDAMDAFWGDLVDQVAFVAYNPWENAYEQPANRITSPCSDLWRRMFIWWDGRANPCDVDYKSMLAVGSITDSDLRSLWRGEAYQRLRQRHLDTKRSEVVPCRSCVVV